MTDLEQVRAELRSLRRGDLLKIAEPGNDKLLGRYAYAGSASLLQPHAAKSKSMVINFFMASSGLRI